MDSGMFVLSRVLFTFFSHKCFLILNAVIVGNEKSVLYER